MTREYIKNFEYKIGNRLHKIESMSHWCLIKNKNGKLIGLNGNGESLENFNDTNNIFKKDGVYRISDTIWCFDCMDWADVFCGDFHNISACEYTLIDKYIDNCDDSYFTKDEISNKEICHVLDLAQCEIRAMYKRNGINGSNVLDMIDDLYNNLKNIKQ